MQLNATTVWFIVVIAAVIGIFDVTQLVTKGQQATISVTLRLLVARWQIIGVAFGVLIGHLWASQCGIPCHGP
jgi:hypothetical protein